LTCAHLGQARTSSASRPHTSQILVSEASQRKYPLFTRIVSPACRATSQASVTSSPLSSSRTTILRTLPLLGPPLRLRRTSRRQHPSHSARRSRSYSSLPRTRRLYPRASVRSRTKKRTRPILTGRCAGCAGGSYALFMGRTSFVASVPLTPSGWRPGKASGIDST